MAYQRKPANGSMLPSGKWIVRVALFLWLVLFVFPSFAH